MIAIKLHVSAFPQADRKRFLAQELIIQFLEPVREKGMLEKGATTDDLETTNAVIAAAYDEARTGANLHPKCSVADHIGATLERARAEWLKRTKIQAPSAVLMRHASAALERFEAAAAALCPDCTADDLCAGIRLRTASRAEGLSRCLTSASELARKASNFTQKVYDTYLADLSHDVEVDVFVAKSDADAVTVSGVTEFIRPQHRDDIAGTTRPVWVELRLPLGTLGVSEYLSMYYVMAHELAVHGVQELLRSGAPAWPKKRVAFAEGLVDRVVYYELIEALRSKETIDLPELGDTLDSIGEFHATRTKVPGAQRTFWAVDIGIGRKAYEMLLKLGRYAIRTEADRMSEPEVAHEARAWAHRSALALNVMPLDEDERHAVAETLHKLDVNLLADGKVQRGREPEKEILTEFVGILGEIQEIPGAADARKALLEVAAALARAQSS